jgi:hypothetical protein
VEYRLPIEERGYVCKRLVYLFICECERTISLVYLVRERNQYHGRLKDTHAEVTANSFQVFWMLL